MIIIYLDLITKIETPHLVAIFSEFDFSRLLEQKPPNRSILRGRETKLQIAKTFSGFKKAN